MKTLLLYWISSSFSAAVLVLHFSCLAFLLTSPSHCSQKTVLPVPFLYVSISSAPTFIPSASISHSFRGLAPSAGSRSLRFLFLCLVSDDFILKIPFFLFFFLAYTLIHSSALSFLHPLHSLLHPIATSFSTCLHFKLPSLSILISFLCCVISSVIHFK